MVTGIQGFSFHIPMRIEYGLDRFKSIGEILKGIGKKALIVTYQDNSLMQLAEECRILLRVKKSQPIRSR